MTRAYLVGNWLIGDSMILCSQFHDPEPDGFRRHIVCNQYNQGVFAFVMRYTTLAIDAVTVLPDNGACGDLNGYYPYIETKMPDRARYGDDLVLMRAGIRFTRPYPMTEGWRALPSLVPVSYLTLGAGSAHDWKNREEFNAIRWPYPVVAFGRTGEWLPKSTYRCVDQSLTRVSQYLLHAQAHVGHHGSMSIFSALLGTPTLQICESEDTFHKDSNVEQCHGRNQQVLALTTEEIQLAVDNFFTPPS